MDEYEGMRKFGREVDKIAGKMREMRASSEVEKMKCGPDGRQSASRERGMTGIERLRGVAGFWRENKLDDIVEQIEREQGERVSRMRVLSVVTEMERHVLGAEGMGDSPVARWARELREALGGNGRDPAADVSVSAYDLLPQEDREAIAWVRDHGGLDYVKSEWRSRVPYDRYERRRQRLLGHIAECETALGRRREIISELNHRASDLTRENAKLRKRAMPAGYEWPRFEDGELVPIGGEFMGKDGKTYTAKQVQFIGKCFSLFDFCDRKPQFSGFYGEPVKRPAVLAADGEPLREGETVWDTDAEADTPLTVVEVSSDLVRCEYTWKDGKTYRPCYPPDQLTHTKPEIDSWERVEEDALNFVEDNAGIPHDQDQMERDMLTILRRCRALAERERGE